jgi:hypothetical protein
LGALLLVGVVQSKAPQHAQQAMVVLEHFLPLSIPSEMSDVICLMVALNLQIKVHLGLSSTFWNISLSELTS